MLQPIYDELAEKYKQANPEAKVAVVKVDCDAERINYFLYLYSILSFNIFSSSWHCC